MKYTLLLVFSIGFFQARGQITVTTITNQIPASGGVNLDNAGNLYIANFGDGLQNSNGTQIWRLDPNGNLDIFATGFTGASGNDFDSQGNLFQSNIGNGTVSMVTPDGTVSLFATTGISCPVGINVDADDNVYVCNCCGTFENTIRKITHGGVSTLFSSGTLFSCPNGITRDKDNNLYVSNFNNGIVIKITPDGTPSYFANISNGGNGNNGHITYNETLDVLFVASHGTSQIHQITMDGIVTVIAGSGNRGNKNGDAAVATFSRPNGIISTVTGDTIYVNSSIPTSNVNFPLNPSVVRMITRINPTSFTTHPGNHTPSATLEIVPNPARQAEIRLSYDLVQQEDLSIHIMDMKGIRVYTRREGVRPSGVHQASIQIAHLPDGVYQCALVGSSLLISQKLVILR